MTIVMKAPTHETHVPVKVELPAEPTAEPEREYRHPPSLWSEGVKCTNRKTGQSAVVARVDLSTMLFRPFWPETATYSSRTEWLQCADWEPEVTLSPSEVAKRAALAKLEAEMALLDATEMAWVSVLAADDDPAKSLAKLEAMRAGGFLKGKVETVAASVDAKKGKGA
jgi:hypothetical protein